MGWLDRLRPNSDLNLLLKGAEQVFAKLSTDGSPGAVFYRTNPTYKASDWKAIKSQLIRIGTQMQPIRKAWADELDQLEFGAFYLNLTDGDRDLLARYVLESSRAAQDRIYHRGFGAHYMLTAILETVVYGGWDADEGVKEQLKEFQNNYIEMCRQHCQLLMQIAKSKSEDRALTDAEKENGKTVRMLREAGRRALVGEKILDDA